MALVIPGGYALASVTVVGTDGTSPFVTTCGINYNTVPGLDLTDAANQVFQAYVQAFGALTFNNYTIQKASVFVTGEGGSGSVDSNVAPFQGLRVGPRQEPIAMALIMRKNTAQFGRTGRGRMFIPGVLDEGNVTPSGSIEPATVGDFTAAGSVFFEQLADLPDAPVQPFLLHNEGSPITAPTPITSFTPAPLVGWIRKRIR